MDAIDELFDGRTAFRAALVRALDAIVAAGCPDIVLFDADFADWPLGDVAHVERLATWCAPRRRCQVLAREFDTLVRRQPRFVDWRRRWPQVVECHAVDDAVPATAPSLLYAPGLLVLRVVDRVRLRGRISDAADDLEQARLQIDALLQQSTVAFPSTTLGL